MSKKAKTPERILLETMAALQKLSIKQTQKWIDGFKNPKKHKKMRRKRGAISQPGYVDNQTGYWFNGATQEFFPLETYTEEEAKAERIPLVFRRPSVIRLTGEPKQFESGQSDKASDGILYNLTHPPVKVHKPGVWERKQAKKGKVNDLMA